MSGSHKGVPGLVKVSADGLGASCQYRKVAGYGSVTSSGSRAANLVGYVREAVEAGAGDCPVVDFSVASCSERELVHLVCAGPMPDVDAVTPARWELPADVDSFAGQIIDAYAAASPGIGLAASSQRDVEGRDPRFEGFGGFDSVDVATYVRIVGRFGVPVRRAVEVLAELDAVAR